MAQVLTETAISFSWMISNLIQNASRGWVDAQIRDGVRILQQGGPLIGLPVLVAGSEAATT